MIATALALSISNSVTEVGAVVAFAAIVGIAIMSLLFFSQARELKRLREWADEEPQRAAEREQRMSTAVALRIQRATAQLAKPAAAPAVRAISAPPATKVAKEAPVLALLPAAPAVVAKGKMEAVPASKPEQAQPPSEALPIPRRITTPVTAPELPAEELPSEEAVPVMAAAAVGAATAVTASGVEAPARAPAPPIAPVVTPRSRPTTDKPPAPRRAAPQRTGGAPRSQPPQRGSRRGRGGPPPGPPFLREERSSRAPLFVVGAIVVAVVVLLVVLFSSGGSGSSGSASNSAKLSPSSSVTSTTGESSHSATSTASHASEVAAAPAETHVVVLNATETAGLAHRLSSNLQQSGYTLATALSSSPSPHSVSVVQYATGHRADAQHVAQTLGISQVQPLDSAIAALSGSATVVVIAGADQATGSSSAGEAPSEGAGGSSG